ncbi:hypothetical protein [Limnobacter sp.]|uniref:hypothetical protein n=1 Tax=Limnobacter sp. TaxID=2003368 RepID=UPI003516435B
MRIRNTLLLAASAFVLLACSKGLDGTYKDELGIQKYEFQRDGTVYISTMGITKESTYVVEDNKVKISDQGDTTIYDLNTDGTIKGPLGMVLKPSQP